MLCGFTEFFSRPLSLLFGEMLLEGNRLVMMKYLETLIFCIVLKPTESLRRRINRRLAMAFCLLQKGEVLALDSFIHRVLFFTVCSGIVALNYSPIKASNSVLPSQ